MSNGEARAALGDLARAEAPVPARNYGIPRGSSTWWVSLLLRVGMSVGMFLLVFMPVHAWMRIVVCVTSAGLLVLRVRELRGLEPWRLEADASGWEGVLSRLPVALEERGFEVRTSAVALQAELRDTLGPHFAFDVIRDEDGIVLLGQRATLRWACRHMGIRGAARVEPAPPTGAKS